MEIPVPIYQRLAQFVKVWSGRRHLYLHSDFQFGCQ